MTTLIPIAVFIAALIAIGAIVGRKFVYLKKLTPEAISNPSPTLATFWADWVPEIVVFFKSIRWREHRLTIIGESEKLLRRIRLMFLKVDTVTHQLINRLRRSTKRHEEILVEEILVKEEPVMVVLDPKEEEQHLIMEIAKNPKDPGLYRKLGDVYLKTGEKENARLSFKTVLDLDPGNWYAKKKVKELPE